MTAITRKKAKHTGFSKLCDGRNRGGFNSKIDKIIRNVGCR